MLVFLFSATQAPEGIVAPAVRLTSPEKNLRWFELVLVLLLTIGGSLVSAVAVLEYGLQLAPQPSTLRWISSGLHEILGIVLLAYVLRRHGRRFKDIGLRWSWQDAAMGLAVIVVAYVAYTSGGRSLWRLHHLLFGTYPQGPRARDIFGSGTVAMLLYSFLNPFFEELIVRAYLMTEVIELTGSKALALWISVIVQTSYHLYYGWWRALALGIQFLVFSLYFARWRRALPLVIAHGFFDVWAVLHLF